MNFSKADLLLNFCVNFVVHWVQIWVLEPQTWWNKCGCLPFQKSKVGDTDTEAVRTYWADTVAGVVCLFFCDIGELDSDGNTEDGDVGVDF